MEDGYLAIENVRVVIDGARILDNVSLRIGRGIHGLIGPNGAGKTTLLKAVAGIIEYEGRILYNSKVMDSLTVAYSPATPIVDPLALVKDVLKAGVYNSRGSFKTAIGFLKRLGLGSYLERRYSSLSSGEQRLVWIARTLGRLARIVLLDEPLSFLDVRNQYVLLNALREYVEEYNAVILLTTHEIHYVWYFDTVSVLDNGRLVYSGPPSSLRREALEAAYGVKLHEVEWEGGIHMYVPVLRRN